MKKLLCFLAFIPMFCFSYTEEMYPRLNIAWNYHACGDSQRAIEYLTCFIDDPETDKMDKLHFLNARSAFFWTLGQREESMQDREVLNRMCLEDPECSSESWKVYEYSFDYSDSSNSD